MSDANIVVISGRLARKPELRQTPSGVSVVDYTVVNNLYRRGGKENEKTTFVRCASWNAIAEFVGTLDKGDHVHVTGELVDDNYTPQGADKPTKGRMKLDNCKPTLLRRKAKPATETEEVPSIPVDASPAPEAEAAA